MRWVVKVATLVAAVLAVSFLTFLMTDLLRGDPAEVIAAAANRADEPEYVDQIREDLGLDEPLPVRYVTWLGDVVQGDLGQSYAIPQEPVVEKIKRTLPNTLQLMILAELVALLVAIPLGVWSAYRANGAFDRVNTVFTFVLLAVPAFVSSLVFIYIFAVRLDLVDATFTSVEQGGWAKSLQSSILPVAALSMGIIAVYVRLLRNDMIATLQEDFVLNARAKGLSARYILFRHALRPSSFSLLTVAGINVGALIGGSVIVEQIFAVNGIGSLLIQSISSRDLITVQAIVLIIATAYVMVNFLVDLLYTALDPRIRRA